MFFYLDLIWGKGYWSHRFRINRAQTKRPTDIISLDIRSHGKYAPRDKTSLGRGTFCFVLVRFCMGIGSTVPNLSLTTASDDHIHSKTNLKLFFYAQVQPFRLPELKGHLRQRHLTEQHGTNGHILLCQNTCKINKGLSMPREKITNYIC